MPSAQNLGPEFDRELESYLLDPVHSRIYDPAPFRMNPDLKPGGTLMLPTTAPENVTTMTLLDENEEPEWTSRIRVFGYWQLLLMETLYYRNVAAPVWAMSLSGGYAEKYIGDQSMADRAYICLYASARPVFEYRREGDVKFYPRGVERHEHDGLVYVASWEGTHEKFVGSERVMLDGEEVWSANFHGRTLLSKGLRPVGV